MKTPFQAVAMLPFLAGSAYAAAGQTMCNTLMGPQSVNPVPTSSKVVTDSVRPTTTITLQSTTTVSSGLVSTYTYTTSTTTTTTAPTITDTASSTTTLFEVQTSSETLTVPTTTTLTSTTSSTSTTTSATTPGFHNIADTLNSDALRRRQINQPHANKRAVTTGAQGVQKLLATQYPSAVSCTSTKANTNTQTVYTQLPRTTTTVYYWARRTIVAKTLTSTSTIFPAHASTTLTIPTTSTVQTTTTLFSTTTLIESTTTTNIIPGPTVWDACKPENIWGPNFTNQNKAYYAVNVANNGPGVGSDFQILANGASSSVDCCNACQQAASCETFIFRARNRNCFLLKHDGETCDSQFNHPNFILSKKGSDPGDGYVIGNGRCGYTYSGNSDSTVFPVDGH